MILTVTANAAIDKRYVVDAFDVGEVNRVKSCAPTAGGKGLNVARVAYLAGASKVTATGFLGGHAGKFIFGYVGDTKVVCMQGRVHVYEGYPVTDVVLPTRLMKMLGAKILFLTNASGGVNPNFNAGDFMLMTDHISTFAPNPLIGANIEELGTRFPDMTEIYDKELRDIIIETAKENDIELRQGVYAQLTGPSFESPAEIRMFHNLGIDAVGMSTVVEAIAANHMGMKICCISFISNPAAGMNENPLTHEEVQEAADAAAPRFKKLVTEVVKKFGEKCI